MKLPKISLKMPKGYSKSIHASVLLLTIFGLAMIVSANANVNSLEFTSLVRVIAKEIFFIVVSYSLMLFAARKFNFSRFNKLYHLFLIGNFAMLLGALAFPAEGGAKAWIRFGSFATIQPSELAKVMVILLLAKSLGDIDNKAYKFSDIALHPIFAVGAIFIIVLIAQNDFGTALIIGLMAVITLMSFSNPHLRKAQNALFFLFIVFLVLIIAASNETFLRFVESLNLPTYMTNRFKMSANPFSDRYNAGAQLYNSLAAFVSGGLWGVGYGKGFLKFSFIYAAESDSILAIIVEELGIVFGFMPIIILYGVIIYQLMKYTFIVEEEKDKAILIGTVAYFFTHFLLNVGGITSFIPLTGVPLLFISAGGSSRMAIMLAIGLSQNVIARHNGKVARSKNENHSW